MRHPTQAGSHGRPTTKRTILAAAFVVAIAAGALLALSLTETTEAQGPPTFSLPAHAAEIAPGVFSLGRAVHNGQIVEGIAIAHHRNNHNGGPGGGGDDGGDPPPPPEPTDPATCFSFIFSGGASWLKAEPYLFNPAGGPGVDVADLDLALNVWEAASSANIFGPGTLTNALLSAETGRRSSPDNLNEVYFASIKGRGSSSTIAFTVVWAVTATGEVVEWDMVFNTNFSWATDGSSNAMDFLNIAAHEAGHAVGMGHTDTDTACETQTMYPTGSNGETDKRDLDVGDVAGVNALYN